MSGKPKGNLNKVFKCYGKTRDSEERMGAELINGSNIKITTTKELCWGDVIIWKKWMKIQYLKVWLRREWLRKSWLDGIDRWER